MSFKGKQSAGFAVSPKLDCPHLKEEKIKQLTDFLLNHNSKHFSQFQCQQCKDTSQNWICMQCLTLGCSRYVKGHMAEHNQKTKHSIALSFSDGSFWCYDCQSYIDAPELRLARTQLSNSKFAEDKDKLKEETNEDEKQKEEEKQVLAELQRLVIDQQFKENALTYEKLFNGLQNKEYKNVVVLTGAGLSVASGIPDFRSPGTGLYSQLEKYNLPFPEAVFMIDFYLKNPEPFMKVAKQYLSGEYHPTLGHKFIKKLQDEGILTKNLTQNIDDLETKAGISAQKLLQAHGHARSAHCTKCHKQASIQLWKQHLQKLQVMKCVDCQNLVKPDIVFFGQQLPKEFYQAPEIVEKADLVFIIGTSLAVAPFSYLGTMIKDSCPLVLVNNEDSIPYRKDKLWMKGDIQQQLKKLMTDLKWI